MFRAIAVFFLVFAVFSPVPASPADSTLLRVERRTVDDLSTLLDAGFSVVMETAPFLLVRGAATDQAGIEKIGFSTRVLDVEADISDYYMLGMRPDSDRDRVMTLGPVLLEEGNLVLLKVPGGFDAGRITGMSVFLTPVPEEELSRPLNDGGRPDQSRSLLADGPPDPIVQKIVDSVLDSSIDAYWLTVTSNPPEGSRFSQGQGCQDASTYAHDEFIALGLSAEYQDWNASHAPNALGTLEGAFNPDDIYIVGGHLDDLPSSGVAPGADDNGSGSVNVLENARVMSCWGFRNTLKFQLWTGEEQGLLGSKAYANAALARNENILGVINTDMPGWEGDGNPAQENLDVSYNTSSQWLAEHFDAASTTYSTGLAVDAFYCPSLTASDHYAFWQKGWDAIIGITDNEGYCSHGGNYPDYHTAADTIANCGDPTFFYSVVRTSAAALAELGEPFKIGFDRTFYTCDGAVQVVVADRDLNTDPGIQESIEVGISSSTETAAETVTLLERGTDSMFFEGMVGLTPDPATGGDGLVSIVEGDALTGSYIDALDCDGAVSVPYLAIGTVDCSTPIISAVDEYAITDSSAEIVWTTSEPADSVVRWGDSPVLDQTSAVAERTAGHTVALAGLQSCTVYYYQVESSDEAGNVAVDDNGGQQYRFETFGDFGQGLQPCNAGRVELIQPGYACTDLITFEVVDLGLNQDPLTVENAVIHLTSSTETVPEEVVVTEAGISSSTFTGSIQLGIGPAASDGILQAGDGDIVTATYHDADAGAGSSAIHFDTAVMDCAGPRIRHLRLEQITDQRLTVLYETEEPGDTVVEWGPTPALGQIASSSAASTSHQAVINNLGMCEPLYLRVSSTDPAGNMAVMDHGGAMIPAYTWDIPGLYYKADFEDGGAGWALTGDWQVGSPQGLGGSSGQPDPAQAYNNTMILGNDLTGLGTNPGDYENSSSQSADSPSDDASSWTNTRLLLYRQLNVRSDDSAILSVMKRNKETILWTSAGTVSESDWSTMALDVSAIVDGGRDVRFRFQTIGDGQGPFGDDGVGSGWNIDDVIVKDGSLPDYAACGGCVTGPAFEGLRSAVDVDACGGGGVTLSWDEAQAWGTGDAGTYAMYRDADPGFTPSAANRVASGLTGLTWTDLAAPTDQTWNYLVRAENDETCGAGPANGGMTDANLSRIQVTESTSRPAAGFVAGVTLAMINDAHLLLTWPPAAGAASYRVYRSDNPATGFVLFGSSTGTSYEDLAQGGNANSWYYRVVAVNPCGEEGP
ncbi:MAG: M28 family peptidase [Acidobacteria bacterium]|uniref:M28 family peptidase n=1 Tax=Candidatus Polarisedimenticola svalbardensis TaxID=2886004 RepID=A0A8J6Y1D7_9BACT|nr:M28 family peptidase [Candidatus Polarisedimenticola svalbardensis]